MTKLAASERTEPLDVASLLASRSVRKVLFIDDGFEPLGQVEPTGEEQQDLWTAIEADAAAFGEAQAFGLKGPEDLIGERIAKLDAGAAGAAVQVVAAASPYVIGHVEKTSQLRTAIDHLRQLGLEVLTAGRDTWRDQLAGVSVVFLDWRLGPEADQIAAVAAAVKTAKEIHDCESRPLIVLISSDPSVKSHAGQFSRQSGLLHGLFDAMPKAWLRDPGNVELQITMLTEHLRRGYLVQDFVNAISHRATGAITEFIETLMGLGLSDYANLQHFALEREGQPLGDYMTKLLSGLWADVLFRGPLRKSLDALDSENFEMLPALATPSEGLAELYHKAVFDTHIGDFGPHPQADMAADKDQQAGPERLMLALGDIVVESDGTAPTRAHVVLNPQCDLVESPRHKRKIDNGLSILLAPGTLRPVAAEDRTARKDAPDTAFFAVDGAKHRIAWEGKKLQAIPYADFPAWLQARSGRRRARMRQPFALALQNAVLSDLGRVGLPVPPPLYEPVTVRVRRAEGGRWKDEPTEYQQGRLLMVRDASADQIVFTHSFLTELFGMVQAGLAVLKGNGAKDAENASAVAAAIANAAELKRFVRPFPLKGGVVRLLGGAVQVCLETAIPTSGFERKLLVCVSLVDPQTTA